MIANNTMDRLQKQTPGVLTDDGVNGGLEQNITSIYYEARTVVGALGLSITTNVLERGYMSPLQYRLELSRIEPLVQRLEDWLSAALYFEPAVEITAPQVLNILMSDDNRSTKKIGVYLPVENWQLAEVGDDGFDLGVLSFEWLDYSTELVLARFNLSPEEQNTIQAKATVLLPQSFEPSWCSTLYVPAINGCLDGRIAETGLTWFPGKTLAVASSQEYNDCRIDCDEVISFCSVSAKTFFNHERSNLSEIISRRFSEHGCVIRCSNGVEALGSLIAIGKGMGLHISRVNGHL